MLYAVILAGGGGTRLWPESRKKRPKPFLTLDGKTTLLAETVHRLDPLIPIERTFILAGEEMRLLLAETLPDFPAQNFLFEPCGRNTAAAIALAALTLLTHDPQAVMAVLPSDHAIAAKNHFQAILSEAAQLIEADPTRLVTLGIIPTRPDTGFGYIRAVKPLTPEISSPAAAYQAASFHEKPDEATARRYLADGGYYWNSGMFLWSAAEIIALMHRFCPEIIDPIEAAFTTQAFDADSLRRAYDQIPSRSIDYAVMEKAENIVTLAADLDWNDLGTFSAVYRQNPEKQDADGNRADGIRLLAFDARNNFIRWNTTPGPNSEEPLIVLSGVEDLEIIRSGNTLLILPRKRDAVVGQIVQKLKNSGEDRYL